MSNLWFIVAGALLTLVSLISTVAVVTILWKCAFGTLCGA
jgi:uncharacterized transporter YbjL